MRLTPARRAWLEHLARVGHASRTRGVVAFQCMKLGWTEWALRDTDRGDIISMDEAKDRYGDASWDRTTTVGEMLTPEGKRQIAPPERSLLRRIFPHLSAASEGG